MNPSITAEALRAKLKALIERGQLKQKVPASAA